MLGEEVLSVLCMSTVLGAPLKVGGRVGDVTHMALVMEAGMHTLKVKWQADCEAGLIRALL